MKKVFVLLLLLTSLAAQAQYHKSRASQSSNQFSYLSYYGSKKFDVTPADIRDLNLPSFLINATMANQPQYSVYSHSIGTLNSQPGYFSGSQMTTTSQNGRFQIINSFDVRGNLMDSKASFVFPKKKR